MTASDSSTWLFRPQNSPPVQRVVRFDDSADNEKGQESVLKLKNNAEFPVAIKFRTNNINSYVVNPVQRILQPDETCNFAVKLKPNFRVKEGDKLLVISTFLDKGSSETTVKDFSEIWRDLDPSRTSKETIWLQNRAEGLKLDIDDNKLRDVGTVGSPAPHLAPDHYHSLPAKHENNNSPEHHNFENEVDEDEDKKRWRSYIVAGLIILILMIFILALTYNLLFIILPDSPLIMPCYEQHPLFEALLCN